MSGRTGFGLLQVGHGSSSFVIMRKTTSVPACPGIAFYELCAFWSSASQLGSGAHSLRVGYSGLLVVSSSISVSIIRRVDDSE